MQNSLLDVNRAIFQAFIVGAVIGLSLAHVHPHVVQCVRRKPSSAVKSQENKACIESGSTSTKDFQRAFTNHSSCTVGDGIEACIGNTPLFLIKSLSRETGCNILAKAEFLNGAGHSPKDRVALRIIQDAERNGLIAPYSGDVIYEGTVGSTGLSLASICTARGYKAHICMPNDQAIEKSNLLLRLGAKVERVQPASIVDQEHFVNRAKNLADAHTSSLNLSGRGFFANQFENSANWKAHFEGTGPEIYQQTKGKLDAFVAGAGTGGTISGVSLYLKSKLPKLKVVLADPQGSGLFNKVKSGVMYDATEREGTRRRHQTDSIVEGIGINRLTHNFEVGYDLIDDAIRVTDLQALKMARWLVENDGIFIGGSSAVNCVAAAKLAQSLGPDSTIVTILCDSGNRHISRFWSRASELEPESVDDLTKVLDL